jgi:hypothetical protein
VCETEESEICPTLAFDRDFFLALTQIDEELTRQVAAAGCPRCGSPLYRGDYDRKPRGGFIAEAGEEFCRRFSLCCGREGCRRRATPPSVRFLGRRFYLGAVVLVASTMALARQTMAALKAKTGVPARTVQRWLGWWQTEFTATGLFLALAGRVVPPLDRARLPGSLLERLGGMTAKSVLAAMRLLGPLTTTSVPDGTRFQRDGLARSSSRREWL